ncbi:MAG: PKD domain-containing protein [Anaerolineae bacterium]|nr:PKD domain-containing protein [Anaerolineae bacterium]
MSRRKGHLLFTILLPFLIAAVFAPARLVAQEPPQKSGPNCGLLDDPAVRGVMSAAFETMLLEECGHMPKRPAFPITTVAPAVAPPTGKDVRVNGVDPIYYSTTQSETSIAVNEDNGTICITYNDSYHRHAENNGISGFSRSTDGGLTFDDRGAVPDGDGGRSRGDPSVVWRRADGRFYYASLNVAGLGLWRSTDDCATFEWFAQIHSSGGDDKEFMAVDNNPASPYYGRFYVAWADYDQPSRIRVAYSDDGVNWSSPVGLSDPYYNAQGAWPATAPNGDVYVAWLRWHAYPYGTIDVRIARSTDGGDSFARVAYPMAGQVTPFDAAASADCGRPALNGRIRYYAMPQLVVGPDGCLHAIYSYDPDGANTGDVVSAYYRRSCDNGAAWDAEVQLNDDGTLTDQFFPALTVTADNVVAASWYDRRLDPVGNWYFDRYWTVSYDGGATWEPNERVSDVSSPVYITPYLSACYHGDYDQMAYDGDVVYHLWSDDRVWFNGHYDPDIWFDRASVAPDFTLGVEPDRYDLCREAAASGQVAVGAVNGYDQPVTLSDSGRPAGVDAAFTVNPVDPLPGSSTYVVTATASAPVGVHTWIVSGDSPTRTHAATVTLVVNEAAPLSPTLLSPPDGDDGVPYRDIPFRWAGLPTATAYRLQVDDDPAFGSPEADVTGILTTGYDLPGPLAPAAAYYWRVGASNGCGAGPFSAPFSFRTQGRCILLVDDDDDDPDARPYYEAALRSLGYSYDVFDVGGGGGDGPALAELWDYPMLIWFSGDKWSDVGEAGPNPADEIALAAYLDGGGRLFLSSQSYLYDFGLTPFGQEYFGISSYVLGAGNAGAKSGVWGDPVGGGLGPYPLTYPSGFVDHGDIVHPDETASVAFKSEAGNELDIDKDGGVWRTVFFGTSWVPVAVEDPASGQEVLERIVDWFGGCSCAPVTSTLIAWQPLTPTAGYVVTFTAAATGTGPFRFAWDLGDGSSGSGALVTHTYALSGSYSIVLTATNPCGGQVTGASLAVRPPCQPVSGAGFAWQPLTPTVGAVVTFTAAATGTPPIDYAWAWGDGAVGVGAVATHAYALSDTYSVVLTATNTCGVDVVVENVVVKSPAYRLYLPLLLKEYGD